MWARGPTQRFSWRWRVARWALWLWALTAWGCVGARRQVNGDIVRYVRFEGNEGLFSGQNDYQLRQVLSQRPSPAFAFVWPLTYFVTPATFSASALSADARRLEVWYAHRGRFDARVLGWEVRRIRPATDKKAGIVDVIGHLEPGPLSLLRSVSWQNVPEQGSPVGTVVRSAIREQGIDEGASFDLHALEAAAAAVTEALRSNGYAYATVDFTADAWPDPGGDTSKPLGVDVVFTVSPGIRTRFGEVRVVGLERVESDVVTTSLAFLPASRGKKKGARAATSYDVGLLRDSQQRIFETGLFSLVNVTPDLSDPTRADVPIRVEVTETRFQRLRTGFGLQYDYFNLSPRLTVGYEDLRFARSRLRVDAEASVGAILGVVGADRGNGFFVTGSGALRFDYPWLLGRRLSIQTGARFKQDAQFGTLPFRQVEADFGLAWRASDAVTLTGGPRLEYFQYLQPDEETLQAAAVQFGGDFTSDTYRLLSVDVGLQIDWRDSITDPRRGSFWALTARQSIPIPTFSGPDESDPGFLYTKLDGEVRGFWSPLMRSGARRFPVTLAGRLHGTLVMPWRQGSALPYPDLAFLGGPNSLRGFRTNQVGPYDCICSYAEGRPDPQHNNGEAYDVTRTYLPKGGVLALEASGEARYRWRYGLSFAFFADVGLLVNRFADFRDEQWDAASQGYVPKTSYNPVVDDRTYRGVRFGGGLGLRYDTPIGAIRLDLGLRPVFPEDTEVTYRFCNPIDELPRAFDLASSSRGARERLDSRSLPVAFNLFFAIGEAF